MNGGPDAAAYAACGVAIYIFCTLAWTALRGALATLRSML